MSSTYTTRINLELQADGENANTWGQRLNSNVIQLIDDAIAGYTIVTVPADNSDYTLTENDGANDQSRTAMFEVAGTISSNMSYILPSTSKFYVVNDKSVRQSSAILTLKTATGTTPVTVTPSSRGFYFSDGTSVQMLNAGGLGLGTVAAYDVANTSIMATADVDGKVSAATIVSIDNLSTSIGVGYTVHGTSVLASTHVVSRESATAITVNAAQYIADDTALTFKNPVSADQIPDVSIADARYVRVSTADTIRGAKTYTSIATFNGMILTPSVTAAIATSAFTLDFTSGNNFTCKMDDNDSLTLANPTSATAGQSGLIYLIQGGTSATTLAYGDMWLWPNASAPTISSSLAEIDALVYNVRSVSAVDSVLIKKFG